MRAEKASRRAKRERERERRITEWETEATGGEEATAARKHDRKTANRTADSGDRPPTADPVSLLISPSPSPSLFSPPCAEIGSSLLFAHRGGGLGVFCPPSLFLAPSLVSRESPPLSPSFGVNTRRRGRRGGGGGGLVPSPRSRPTRIRLFQVLLGTISD